MLVFLYGLFDSEFRKNLKNINENILIEPAKLIITSKLNLKNILNLNWLFSKRLNLILTSDILYLGKSIICLDDVKEVKITYYSSFLGLIKYQVLQFVYENNLYLLGTSMTPEWNLFFKTVYEKRVNRKKNFYIYFIMLISLLLVIYSISKSLSIHLY